MRKVTVTWGDHPISEKDLIQKLQVRFWEPEIFAALPLNEQRSYLDLRWWDAKVQKHLPLPARDFYRRIDESRSRSRFGELSFSEQLASIPDPLDRLDAINDSIILLLKELGEISQMRRETLLVVESEGVTTRELADVMHVTLPRVRQLILEARRKSGLPVEPQHGGRPRKEETGD